MRRAARDARSTGIGPGRPTRPARRTPRGPGPSAPSARSSARLRREWPSLTRGRWSWHSRIAGIGTRVPVIRDTNGCAVRTVRQASPSHPPASPSMEQPTPWPSPTPESRPPGAGPRVAARPAATSRTGEPGESRGPHPRCGRAPRPLAGRPDDPRGQPRPAERRRAQGRRPPGVVGLDRLHPDRALLPLAAAAATSSPIKPHACPALPRDPVPDGRPRPAMLTTAARVRRPPVVPVADQGPGSGRLLDRVGGPGRRGADVRGARRPLPAAHFREPSRAGPTGGSWPWSATRSWTRATSGRPCSRRRSRRPRQRDADRGPQPPEPGPGRAGHPRPPLEGDVRGGRLAGAGGQVRPPAPGSVSRCPAARRCASASTRCPTRNTRS